MHSTVLIFLLALAYSVPTFAEFAYPASPSRKAVIVPHFVARQASTGTAATSALPSTTISPPSNATAASVNISVATSIVNEPLPTISVVHAKKNGASSSNTVDGSIELACANCSTFGTLGVTAQSFMLGNGTLTGGIVQMEANGFGGIFELNLTSAQLQYDFSHQFFSFPIAGIGLPGIPGAQAGILLTIGGDFSIELDDSIGFTFGGSFSVPDGSVISFDTIDVTNSSQHGFTPSTGLQLSSVPFQANISSPTLTASVAIQPKLTLGIHAAEIYAEAGVDFDLPRLTVEIARLTNVDATCHALNATNSGKPVPGNVTNAIPSAEVDVGLIADAAAFQIKGSDGTQLASAKLALPTECLVFDASASALTSAAAATSTGASNSSGVIGGQKGNAAPSPSEGHVWYMMWGFGLSSLLGMMLM